MWQKCVTAHRKIYYLGLFVPRGGKTKCAFQASGKSLAIKHCINSGHFTQPFFFSPTDSEETGRCNPPNPSVPMSPTTGAPGEGQLSCGPSYVCAASPMSWYHAIHKLLFCLFLTANLGSCLPPWRQLSWNLQSVIICLALKSEWKWKMDSDYIRKGTDIRTKAVI